MEMYDFGSEFAQGYQRTCDCGKVIEVSAQRDRNPEYYTDIFVKCECGKSVQFTLPVN